MNKTSHGMFYYFMFYCVFSSLVTQKKLYLLHLSSLELIGLQARTQKKQSHFSYRKKELAWPWLSEIPSVLDCISSPEHLSLVVQKAD